MHDSVKLSLLLAPLACLLAIGFGWLVIRFGPKDHPDGGRKSQAKAMPTAGGIAIFGALYPLSLIALLLNIDWLTFPIGVLLGGGVYMFLMGLWDDLVELPALPKLIAQLVVALVVAWFGVRVSYFDLGQTELATGIIIGTLGSAAWLVVVTNAVNFMDGSDGLAMGCCAAIAGSLGVLSGFTGAYDIMTLSLVLFGALLGHLFWNGRGKLFTGDTGSLMVGFYLAGLLLLWIERMHISVWVAPLFFIAFLTDVLLTLIWRYKHSRNLLTPHNEHIYQIMLRAGVTQLVTAWIFVWATLHGVLIGGLSLMFPAGGAMIGFALLMAIFYVIHRRIRASAVRNGILKVGGEA